MPLVKHIPQRTCVACGKVRPQRELVRIVRVEDGVEIDLKGKKRGRGAYLCCLPDCWNTGLKGNKLERALRVNLSPEYRGKLTQDLKELFGGQS